MIVILFGKSATGKDTVLRKLRDEYGYIPIISTTTRPMRVKEKQGVDYNFVSKEEFLKMIEQDSLIEYRSYNTLVNGIPDIWYYGVPKFAPIKGENFVVVLDLVGTEGFLKYFGNKDTFIVEISTDDAVRKQRAIRRGSFDETEWQRRLADDEVKFADGEKFRDVCIENDGTRSIHDIAMQIDNHVKEITAR